MLLTLLSSESWGRHTRSCWLLFPQLDCCGSNFRDDCLGYLYLYVYMSHFCPFLFLGSLCGRFYLVLPMSMIKIQVCHHFRSMNLFYNCRKCLQHLKNPYVAQLLLPQERCVQDSETP